MTFSIAGALAGVLVGSVASYYGYRYYMRMLGRGYIVLAERDQARAQVQQLSKELSDREARQKVYVVAPSYKTAEYWWHQCSKVRGKGPTSTPRQMVVLTSPADWHKIVGLDWQDGIEIVYIYGEHSPEEVRTAIEQRIPSSAIRWLEVQT